MRLTSSTHDLALTDSCWWQNGLSATLRQIAKSKEDPEAPICNQLILLEFSHQPTSTWCFSVTFNIMSKRSSHDHIIRLQVCIRLVPFRVNTKAGLGRRWVSSRSCRSTKKNSAILRSNPCQGYLWHLLDTPAVKASPHRAWGQAQAYKFGGPR